jgi:hypothetical protein
MIVFLIAIICSGMTFYSDIVVVLRTCTKNEFEANFINMIWERASEVLQMLCSNAQQELVAYIGDFCLFLTVKSRISSWAARVRSFSDNILQFMIAARRLLIL